MKESFQQDTYSEINIKMAKVGRPIKNFKDYLMQMWPTGKNIWKKDIRDIMHLIPLDCQSTFYKNLVGNEIIVDDVDGFTGNLEFEVDNGNW